MSRAANYAVSALLLPIILLGFLAELGLLGWLYGRQLGRSFSEWARFR